MKIALIALTRGNLSGGNRKHLSRVVPLLRAHPEVERLDVFLPPAAAAPGEHTWPHRDEWRGFPALRRSIADLRPDVVFIPNARLLALPGIPVVTMVRNMEPLEVPFGGNTLPEAMRNLARSAVARRACRGAERVIAVSRHVEEFLVGRWGIARERVGMVHHGVDAITDEGFIAPPHLRSLEDSRFIFTAGSIRPARGLEDLIAALPHVPADVRLVIAGSVDRGAEGYARRLRRLADEGNVSGRILWAGQLDASAMAWCFRRATSFVMTSRAEACPNTVLEALANGALSVSTDHAPMPEFFGDTALYYAERDAAHLALRIGEALALPQEARARLHDAAQARARLFSWETTAERTLRELRRAAER